MSLLADLGHPQTVGFLPETNPLFCAIYENNLKKLKKLVERGHSINTTNYRGTILLNTAIEHKRKDIFDYLISLKHCDINATDGFGRSALLYAATEAPDDYYASQLITRGANVHLSDKSGATFLIRVASRLDAVNMLKVGRWAIEKGADVDAQAQNGVTALYAACEIGTVEWICMLLYYGADPNLVPDDGMLPVVKLPRYIEQEHLVHLQEVLFNCTFDHNRVKVLLPTLTAAMSYNNEVFPNIVVHTKAVRYDLCHLEQLHMEIMSLEPRHLALFLKKFGKIVRKMIENYPPSNILRRIRCPIIDFGFGYPNDDIVRLKENLQIFLESDLVADFVRALEPTFPTIFRLIDIFRRNKVFAKNEEEEITKMISVMLSYGLGITAADMYAVYTYYGYCELFKMLLHMDINVTHHVMRGCIMPRLCYDPCKDIEDFKEIFPTKRVLDYYSLPKVKEMFLAATSDKEIVAKVRKLPVVPCLVELSRNACRKFIVQKFKVKNSREFYTVLKWLPIGEMNKRIIALEQKLYYN